MNTSRFQQREGLDTSATAVLMNSKLEHIFAYKPGASEAIDRSLIDDNLDFIAQLVYRCLNKGGICLEVLCPPLHRHNQVLFYTQFSGRPQVLREARVLC